VLPQFLGNDSLVLHLVQQEGQIVLLWDAPGEIKEYEKSLKETPHNARGPLAGEFQPLAACKNLDYPPGNLRFLQFAIG